MGRWGKYAVVGVSVGALFALTGAFWLEWARDPLKRANRLISRCEEELAELEHSLQQLEQTGRSSAAPA